MGLFGNKNNHAELVNKMANDANKTKLEIEKMIVFMKDNQGLINSFHSDFIAISEQIMNSASGSIIELEKLAELARRYNEVREIFDKMHVQILELNKNQNERVKLAIDNCKTVSKK